MDKILVVVFENEEKAYKGSRALQDLQEEGSINLYAKAVISRDSDGKLQVKQSGEMGPIGTSVGMLTGTWLGLLGGPVGLAIGASAGTFGGMLYDLAHLGVREDFLDEVGKSLLPGKAAVVAEVWEDWTLPVDTKMEAVDGVVFRRTRRDILDDQIESDIITLKAEINELELELERANGETKSNLQAKLDAAMAKMQVTRDGIQARLESSQQETEAKIQSLQQQAIKAEGERKAKIEKRITELQADQKRRGELLKQAGGLIKDALVG